MDVQKLNVILEALKCGSITKAADKLGYTQSGLTYAINSFEGKLGFPVVIRDSGGIRLSREGQELLPYMERMVECERQLVEKAKTMLSRMGKTLNVGTYPSLSERILPEILAEFNSEEPDVKINLLVGDRDEIINWLLSGTVDFGLGGEITMAGFEWMPLIRDPEVAIFPEDFPTEGMASFPMDDFKRHPFIRPTYWAEENDLASKIEAHGIEPQFIVEAGDNSPVIAMVGQGIGISTVPVLTIPDNVAGIKFLPMEPPCSRILGVNYRQSSMGDPTARSFLECLKKCMSL